MTRIVIVNENDEVIGAKERDDITKADIYRASSLWITNSKGEVLLAQRSFTKSHDPGKWGPAVAGTVEEGETYKDNIIKEAKEELGLEELSLTQSIKGRETGKHNFFVQLFTAKVDKDISEFKIEKREVEQIKWFSKEELSKELKTNSYRFLRSIPGRVKELYNIS